MEARHDRTYGLSLIALGCAVAVLAVLLFGFTKPNGELDWVNIIMGSGGLVMALVGLYVTYRNRGTGATPGGPTPHGAG